MGRLLFCGDVMSQRKEFIRLCNTSHKAEVDANAIATEGITKDLKNVFTRKLLKSLKWEFSKYAFDEVHAFLPRRTYRRIIAIANKWGKTYFSSFKSEFPGFEGKVNLWYGAGMVFLHPTTLNADLLFLAKELGIDLSKVKKRIEEEIVCQKRRMKHEIRREQDYLNKLEEYLKVAEQ